MEEIYAVEAMILNGTQGAILIEVNQERLWIPRSQLIDEEDLPDRGQARVKMTAWIAKEKGLI